MPSGPFIVISGLPAAGKTAIGRQVSRRMQLPFFDKDEYLEREFDNYSEIDPSLRSKLSRKSDDALATEAMAAGAGILVSFWRPTGRDVDYGTPTNWLEQASLRVIELYCRCEPAIARQRFLARNRHPGHNDATRRNDLMQQFDELASFGALSLWPAATIDTTALSDISALVDEAMERIYRLIEDQC
jgi:hypothetical protein